MNQVALDVSSNTNHEDSAAYYYCAPTAKEPVNLEFIKPFENLENFTSHSERPQLSGASLSTPFDGFAFPVLAVLTIGYLLVYRMAPSRFQLTLSSFYNHRLIHEQSKDEANVSIYYQLSMLLLALISLGWFTTELLKWGVFTEPFMLENRYWLVVLLLIIAVSLWLGIKVLLLNLSGNLFKIYNQLREYSNTVFHYTHLSGLLIFFVLVGLHFFEWPALFDGGSVSPFPFLYTGIFIITSLYLLRVLKTLYFGSRLYSISLYYNILYLCALEFLPLLLVARWVTSNT